MIQIDFEPTENIVIELNVANPTEQITMAQVIDLPIRRTANALSYKGYDDTFLITSKANEVIYYGYAEEELLKQNSNEIKLLRFGDTILSADNNKTTLRYNGDTFIENNYDDTLIYANGYLLLGTNKDVSGVYLRNPHTDLCVLENYTDQFYLYGLYEQPLIDHYQDSNGNKYLTLFSSIGNILIESTPNFVQYCNINGDPIIFDSGDCTEFMHNGDVLLKYDANADKLELQRCGDSIITQYGQRTDYLNGRFYLNNAWTGNTIIESDNDEYIAFCDQYGDTLLYSSQYGTSLNFNGEDILSANNQDVTLYANGCYLLEAVKDAKSISLSNPYENGANILTVNTSNPNYRYTCLFTPGGNPLVFTSYNSSNNSVLVEYKGGYSTNFIIHKGSYGSFYAGDKRLDLTGSNIDKLNALLSKSLAAIQAL